MSKSLGNGIDPLEVIDQYGADALRFTLVTGNSPGNDMRFSDEKVEASRNFANKIWNAARFILMNIDGQDVQNELPEELGIGRQVDCQRSLISVVKEVTENLEQFELGIAVQKLYDFLWDELLRLVYRNCKDPYAVQDDAGGCPELRARCWFG